MMENGRVYHRENCVVCGECTTECYAQALEVIGKEVGIEEVIEEVLKDLPFYDTSGGGMTISGGEPMMQFGFTKALLEEAKKHKLHTCLDTSGFAPYERYRELLGLVDIFLYDIKETDPENHLKFTGVPLDLISENLKKIDKAGGKTVLRCPLIPGLNARDEHLKKIASIASELENVIEIDLHPYHPLGKSKSDRIGKEYSLKELTFAEDTEVERWKSLIESLTKVPVKRG
jgi:pyruvate formate lyase activating enzyme